MFIARESNSSCEAAWLVQTAVFRSCLASSPHSGTLADSLATPLDLQPSQAKLTSSICHTGIRYHDSSYLTTAY